MRLHVHAWGEPDAPPVVCLHGVTGHGARFRMLAERALARRFRVLAPDLRGHGRSPWEPPWNVEQHVADLLETVAADGAVWLGHSFGGRLVAEVARRQPDRVTRAVLLDPALRVDATTALEKAELERSDASYASPDDAIEERLASGLLLSTPRSILEEEMRAHLEPGADGRLRYRYCKSAVVTAWSEMTTEPPPLPAAPTLVVVGAESWLRVDLPASDALSLVTVPGGHSVLWDAFEATAEAIGRFLA